MIMRIIQAFLLLWMPWCLLAQDIQFTASVSPNVLRIGEQFNLTYTSNQELTELNLPQLNDFELLGGPSQGHSQSVNSANGKITTTSTWQYTYFLRAAKEGKFTIQPASAKIKNKAYQSNTVTVEVVKSNNQPSTRNQVAPDEEQNLQPDEIDDKDIFVSLILDKKEAYLGEQIVATVKLFTKTNLAGIDQGFKGPDFTGFFTEPYEVQPIRSLQREAVNGEIYYTGVLRKAVIIPQKSGELIIQPFNLDVAIRQETSRRIADPLFEDFVIPDVQEIPVKLSSKAVKIKVKPLPNNAPSSFEGAVGNFRLASSLNKTKTATNDPLTLKMIIEGKGNIKLINEVAFEVPYDMEKYDPVINTHLDNPLSGTKTFEYLLVPHVAGQFTIPSAEFTYFDPGTRQYKTLRTQSYLVQVEKGQGDTLMAVGPGITKEDVKLLNQDIRFIKTKPFHLRMKGAYIAQSSFYFLFYFLAFIVLLSILIIRSRLIRQNSDIAGVRLRKADKFARIRLKKSAALMKRGNDTAFFEELLGATWGYLGDKLRIPVAELSKDSAKSTLESKSVDQLLIDRLVAIIDKCEVARYSRESMGTSMDKLYNEALDVITQLQHKLK